MRTPTQPPASPDGRNASGKPKLPPPRPIVQRLWWVAMALILAWNLYTFFVPKAPPAAVLSYTAFLEQIRADNVASVALAGQNADGAFRSAITQPPEAGKTDVTPAPTAAQPTAADAAPASFTRFTTVMPVTGDERLLPLLEEHGVSVTAKDTTGGSWFLDLAISFLPMLLLVGLLVYMGRQSQRGSQSLFNFGGSKARVYNQEKPGITFADVAGQVEAKAELLEVVDFLKRPERYRQLGARLPRGVLLVGPPGTGKTLLARAVAGEASVPFFSISASEFVEMFVGVGASRVRDLFTKAKAAAPAIVFVDEIDAVGRQRGTGMGGGNDEREQTLNQLLVELDGFDDQTSVIVIAATNRPDVLDPALLRPGRFDREVTVGLPDRAGREAILAIHTRPLRLDPEVSLELIARRTPGFSGADLANLANEAALAAARRGETDEVAVRDFDAAMDKIVLGTRQATLQDEGERRLVAYHEAGHALVARLTPGADPVSKITIIPHGRALGVTQQFSEEDRRNYSRAYLVGRLTILLGGRAAEDLVFGDPSTGAESDLRQATGLARRMVGLWGMSEELGSIWYGVGETHPFLGREMGAPKEYAEATAATLDVAVRKLVENAHQQALGILRNHRSCLDAIAAALLVHESLDGPRLDSLLAADGACTPSSDGLGRTPTLAAYDG